MLRNDVIPEVNNAPVKTIEDFDAAIPEGQGREEKENVAFAVQRGDKKQLMIALKLPK